MTHSMTDSAIDDPMLDEEWLAAPVKRSRLRAVLVVILAAAICFLGGAIVQRHFGTSPAETAGAPVGFPGGGQLPAGMPEGVLPGAPSGLPDADAESPADADGTESVIGNVVKVRGEVWIVEDLGGKRHPIRVSDDTGVIEETRSDITAVKVGDPVDVSGTTSNGQLRADEVTLR